MEYSFSTVIMAVISSNLIIVLAAALFRRRDVMVSFGYRMFALLLGAAFLRFALPFQFPFTSNIILPRGLSRVVSAAWHTLFTAGPVRVSAWTVFELAWAAGALVRLALLVRNQLVFRHWVVWYSINVTGDEYYARLLDEACAGKPNPFCIFELPGLKVPMLYGMHRPRILIPAGMELQEGELRYLLSHETAHHFHHDIAIKLVVSLLEVVYWWNPACRVLKGQLDAVLEMRIDDYVTAGTFEATHGYLKCLIRVAEDVPGGEGMGYIRVPENSIALFNPGHYNTLTNRFTLMSDEPKRYAGLLHVSALVFTAALFLFSYAFIFEARYAAPEEDITTIDLSGADTYAVQNEDRTYSIYFRGCLVDTVDTLENYYQKISVYRSLDEVPEELRAGARRTEGD